MTQNDDEMQNEQEETVFGDEFSAKKLFGPRKGLYPSETLYPSEDLYPSDGENED